MSDTTAPRLARSFAFVLVALIIIFMALDPYGLKNPQKPTIDLLFPWIAAFMLRRPGSANFGTVLFVLLFQAVLIDAPLGLWAAAQLMAIEALRRNWNSLHQQGFWASWLWVTLAYAAAITANWLIARLSFLPMPDYSLVLRQILFTFLLYPVFSGIIFVIFNTRNRRYTPKYGWR